MFNRVFYHVFAWAIAAALAFGCQWPVDLRVPGGQKLDIGKFELTWSDEFDGNRLDLDRWNLHGSQYGWGSVDGTEDVITRREGFWTLEMAKPRKGKLHISSVYAEEGIAGGPPGFYSVGIDTEGSFEQKFGYFEVRCKLPEGEGLWSAFWSWVPGVNHADGSGQDGTEIDVFESLNYVRPWPLKNRVDHNLHFDGYWEAHQHGHVGSYYVRNPYNSFHTYGVEWNENEYIFYIDGIETARSSFGGVSQVEQYFVLSVEHEAGWTGDIRNNEKMTDFVVDYVRMYQYK
jgi:beta-glucanase (GH16 family)